MVKRFIFILLFVLSAAIANSEDITLQWNANTEPDLAGYKLYQGIEPGVYGDPVEIPLTDLTDIANPEYKVTGLELRTYYYFALKASDFKLDSRDSNFSNELFYSDEIRFSEPVNFHIYIENNGTVIINTGVTE